MTWLHNRLVRKLKWREARLKQAQIIAEAPITEDEIIRDLKRWFTEHKGFVKAGETYPELPEVLEKIRRRRARAVLDIQESIRKDQNKLDFLERVVDEHDAEATEAMPSVMYELQNELQNFFVADRLQTWNHYRAMPEPDESDLSLNAAMIREAHCDSQKNIETQAHKEAIKRTRNLYERIVDKCGVVRDWTHLRVNANDPENLVSGSIMGSCATVTIRTDVASKPLSPRSIRFNLRSRFPETEMPL